jgi:hypothetical protein
MGGHIRMSVGLSMPGMFALYLIGHSKLCQTMHSNLANRIYMYCNVSRGRSLLVSLFTSKDIQAPRQEILA